MTKLFDRIFCFLSRHKLLALLAVAAFIAVGIGVALNMEYEEDISKFLPENEEQKKNKTVYESVSDQQKVAVIFTSADTARVMAADTLTEAMETFAAAFEAIDTAGIVENMTVAVDDASAFEMVEFVYANIPYFLQDADYRRIDSLLAQKEYAAEQLRRDKEQLQMPATPLISVMRYDPLGLFSPVAQRLGQLSPDAGFDIRDGYVFTADGKNSLMYFDTPFGMVESKDNQRLTDMLSQAADSMAAQWPGVKATPVGSSVIAVGNASQIKRDSLIAMTLSVVVILLLLVLHYRRLSDLWHIAASILFGWLFALTGMYFFRDSVSVIVLGLGSVIIGICVNYPLHYLDHLIETGDTRRALRDMTAPLLIGNITTVAAFLCLVWLDAKAMRDLGLFGSLMLVGTILFVLLFLPLFAKPHSPGKARLNINVDFLSLDNKRQRRLFMTLTMLLTVVFGYFSLKTTFDSNLQNINYMTADQRQGLELMSGNMPSPGVYAVAEGKTRQEAAQVNDSLTHVLSSNHAAVRGIGAYLLTPEKQQERLDKWKEFTETHPDLYSKLLPAMTAEGFAADAFSPFGELLHKDFEVEDEDYFSTLTSQITTGYMVENDEGVKIVNYITADEALSDSLCAKVNGAVPGAFAFTPRDISSSLVTMLNDSFNYIGFVCGFVVFFFLWLSFGRMELSLLSFLPLAVSWLWILGLMYLFGVKFNIVNIILATFIFGQGDDYTIFITEGLIDGYARGKEQLKSYKRSVALSAVVMFVGIGTLIFAKHPALRSLAQVTVIGMFTVVMMAYYLPPIVFRWMTMKNDRKRMVPLTLPRLGRTVLAFTVFLLLMLGLKVYTWFYFLFKKDEEGYHRVIYKFAKFVMNKIPGVNIDTSAMPANIFDTPNVVVCNHQSHLDLLGLLSLSPKIVFLTNQWAWRSPFYGSIIHRLNFIPVSDGIEVNLPKIRRLYEQGYSIVIFPEGTRSTDFKIHPFHKGAFYLARELGCGVVPVFIHGAGHVLPKVEFMLNKGTITVEAAPVVSPGDELWGKDDREAARLMRRFYVKHYEQMCRRIENSEYYKWFLHHQYIYKGIEVERRYKRNMSKNKNYSEIVDADVSAESRVFEDCGQGELPMLYALCHPDVSVTAITKDEDDYLLMTNMAAKLVNLTVELTMDNG